MLLGYEFVITLRFCEALRPLLELFGERDFIEKCPGIVEFVVPMFLELLHGRKKVPKFLVPHEDEEGGVYSW